MWDFSVKGTCFDINHLVNYGIYASGKLTSLNLTNSRIGADQCKVFSAFVDIYLAIYPAIVLFHLQISLKKFAPAGSIGISPSWKKFALAVALGIGAM